MPRVCPRHGADDVAVGGIEHIDEKDAIETVNILLKYRSDIEKAIKEFSSNAPVHFDEANTSS